MKRSTLTPFWRQRRSARTTCGGRAISVDTETDRQAWGATLQLSERHGLTLYDAAYLELSLRRGLPLASLDAELRRAAQIEGVVVLGS